MSKFITSDPPYNPSEYPTTAGFLELANGVALSTTLTNVTDQLNTASTLYLSTNQVKIGSAANDTPLALFGNKNIAAIFNTIQLTGTDKTFTFPDVSMTFAGINIAQTFTAANTFSATNTFTVAQTFNNQVSAESLRLTGTGGAGHLHLLFQSGNPTLSSATTTVLYGDSAGNLRLKNGANNWWTTFSTSANGQDSTYTFPNVASTTLAGLSVAQTFTAAQTLAISNSTGSTDLLINPTTKTSGNLISIQINGSNRFLVANTGAVTIGQGVGVNAISFFAPSTFNGETLLSSIGNAGYDKHLYFSGSSGSANFTTLGVNIGATTNAKGALLRLGAGTAAANTAPLKFTAGTNLTTPENGTFEYDGSFLYFTIGL